MDNMMKPHLITAPAFFITSQIGRTFNGVDLTGMSDPFLYFNALNECTPDEVNITAGLMGLIMIGGVHFGKAKGVKISKWKYGMIFGGPALLCSCFFSWFSVPGITQLSLLACAIGNQGIMAALNHNTGGIKDKLKVETTLDFSLRINNALRADPIIGAHIRQQDMKITMDSLLQKNDAKADDISFYKRFRLFYNVHRMDGFTFVESNKRSLMEIGGLDPNKSFGDNMADMRKKSQGEMTKVFPYEIPDVDERKNELLKRFQSEAVSYEHKRTAETVAYWHQFQKNIKSEEDLDDLFDDEHKFDKMELYDLRESHRDENEDEPIWRVYER